MTPGSKTSEFKVTWMGIVGTVVACIIAAGPYILQVMPPNAVGYAIVAGVIAVAGILAGVFAPMKYTEKRTQLKLEEMTGLSRETLKPSAKIPIPKPPELESMSEC